MDTSTSQPHSSPPPLAQPMVTPPSNSQDHPMLFDVADDVHTPQANQEPRSLPPTLPWPSTPAKVPPPPIDTKESPEPPPKRTKKALEPTPMPKPVLQSKPTEGSESQGFVRPSSLRRTRRKPSTSLGATDVSIQDFIDEGILRPGDALKYDNIGGPLIAFITKDGWVTGDEDTYPTVELWLQASFHHKQKPSRFLASVGDPWSLVTTGENKLSEIRDAYVEFKAELHEETRKIKRRRISEMTQHHEDDVDKDSEVDQSNKLSLEIDSMDSSFIPASHSPDTTMSRPLISSVSEISEILPTSEECESLPDFPQQSPPSKKTKKIEKKKLVENKSETSLQHVIAAVEKVCGRKALPSNVKDFPQKHGTVIASDSLQNDGDSVPPTVPAGKTPVQTPSSQKGDSPMEPPAFNADSESVNTALQISQVTHKLEEAEKMIKMFDDMDETQNNAYDTAVQPHNTSSTKGWMPRKGKRKSPEEEQQEKEQLEKALAKEKAETLKREIERAKEREKEIVKKQQQAAEETRRRFEAAEAARAKLLREKRQKETQAILEAEKEKAQLLRMQNEKIAKEQLEKDSTPSAMLPPPLPKQRMPAQRHERLILPTDLKHQLMVHLRMTTDKCGGRVAEQFSKNVTHVVAVVDESGCVPKRTFKYASGILAGAWVVSFNWVLESFAAGTWLDESKYEVAGDSHSLGAPKKGRLQAGQSGLFCKHSFFFSPSIKPTICANLASLVAIGSGEVLKETPSPPTSLKEVMASGAQVNFGRTIVVLGDSAATVEEAKKLYLQTGRAPLSYEWVMQCVSEFRVVETTNFLLAVFHGEDMAALQTQNSQYF